MNKLYYLFFPLLLLGCGPQDQVTETASTSAPTTSPAPAAAPPKHYPTEEVSIVDVRRPVRLSGRVIPLQEATISSQVPGIVLPTEKLLQEGKYYRQGEAMVRIDDEQLRLGLKADRSQLVTALVRILSDLSIDYPVSYPDWEVFTNAIKPEQTLPELPEISNNQLNYYINAAGIPAQYYAIRAREALLDDYTVRAPFSGKLTMAQVDPGSYITPGTPLAKISRTDVYEVRATLPAKLAETVKIGQRLQLLATNLGQTYSGKVNRFGTTIDPATQSVPVFIRVSGQQLRSGLYLEAELPGTPLAQVAVLPKEALTRDNGVYVIQEGIVRAKPVEIALVESDKVFVRGLSPGDRVITQQVTGAIIGSKAK